MWLVDHWPELGVIVLAVVGAASVTAATIAPLTKNKTDDKIAAALGKLHSFLGAIALHPKGKK